MTRKLLVLVVVAVGMLALGCSLENKAPLEPKSALSDRIVSKSADGDGIVVRTDYKVVNGVRYKIETRQATARKGGPSLMRIIYVCDFPMGMYGPPSPGHCWEDGGGCTGYDPGYWGWTASRMPVGYLDAEQAKQLGDPDATGDAARAGDPDGSGVKALGDPDDTGNRAIQFGPPPTKGDPTADD